MRAFSELEMDALAEAFNLALGEAAATFSAIVHEEIELSVPVVEFVSRDELTRRLQVAGRDEIGALANAFNSFADQVQGLVRNINSTSATLNDSSIELAQIMA